jgi:lysophospholipase L1-like esterase
MYDKPYMRILAFGDSITYGAWDTSGGWVDRLKAEAHATTVKSNGQTKIQVLNLGVGGDTTASLLERIEAEIIARTSPNWPFTFIISIGTNDGRAVNGIAEVSIEQFQSNIEAIIAIALKYTEKVIFLGLPPLGGDELNFKGQIYSDAVLHDYDTVLKSIVVNNDVEYIPIRALFENDTGHLFSYDGLHPNDQGHVRIAASIRDFLGWNE